MNTDHNKATRALLAPGASVTISREGISTAHMIAAAPELYEALEALVRHAEKLGRSGAVYERARAVLAKARGEA